MTPTARRIMEKVRQMQPATHEQWVQMHVDLALEEAAKIPDQAKRAVYSDDEIGKVTTDLIDARDAAAAIRALKSQEPAQ